jgi:4-amino-4-deoxy-L-arabinose transferase-like glycosyltransferase
MAWKSLNGIEAGNGRFPVHRVLLASILLLYLLITFGYSVIVPLFETPDEHFHFFTLNELANTGRLPVVPETYDPYLGPEPAQPPLFYMIAALLVAPFDTAAAREQVQLNPYAWIGSAEAVVNVNRTITTPQEQWPWQGYALAAHLVRVLSVLFGLGTVLAVYGSARLVWPQDGRFALLAAALTAFLPQFNFINAAVSNDPLITFLASTAIWQLLRLWFGPVSRSRLLLLGITIGLAALSKNAGILLLLYALGFLFLRILREENNPARIFRCWAETAVLIILPVLLLAGWLWLRNQSLYGDFTATNQFIEIAGGDRQYTLWQVLAESSGLWLSFIAIFGWFNVRAFPWIYAVWNTIFLLAVLGALWQIGSFIKQSRHLRIDGLRLGRIRNYLSRPWFVGLLLAGWLLAVYAGLVTFMLKTEAAQGRLLFPAIVPIMLGVTYGLSGFKRPWLYWLVCGVVLGTTVAALFGVIKPVYALPEVVSALPDGTQALHEPMGNGLVLVGASVDTETAVPGDVVWYTLYWQLEKPVNELVAMKFEMYGRDTAIPIGAVHTFHGRGQYPPTLWPVGVIMADRVPVRLLPDVDAPVLARGFVRLVAVGEDGSFGEGVFVGGVKVVPQQWPKAGEPLAFIGEDVALTAVSLSTATAQPGQTITIHPTWQVRQNIANDYATLIHLALPNQPPIAQGDNQPRAGSYPTHLWETGEVIHDDYVLTISQNIQPGCYPLWLGMYDPITLQRRPLTIAGQRQPNDVYQIGELCITTP